MLLLIKRILLFYNNKGFNFTIYRVRVKPPVVFGTPLY